MFYVIALILARLVLVSAIAFFGYIIVSAISMDMALQALLTFGAFEAFFIFVLVVTFIR